MGNPIACLVQQEQAFKFVTSRRRVQNNIVQSGIPDVSVAPVGYLGSAGLVGAVDDVAPVGFLGPAGLVGAVDGVAPIGHLGPAGPVGVEDDMVHAGPAGLVGTVDDVAHVDPVPIRSCFFSFVN